MESLRSLAWRYLGVVGVAALAAACTGDPKGQLVIAVQTDMSVPEDLNALRIEVLQNDVPVRGGRIDTEIRPFDRDGIYLPGSLGIVEGELKDLPIQIRVSSKYKTVSGEDGGVFRTLREVVTRVPSKRVAALPISFQWLCSEDPSTPDEDREYLTQVGDDPRNACGDGRTCIGGTCKRNAVDQNELNDYRAEDFTGGGGPDGEGTCFDTLGCFDEGAMQLIPESVLDEDGNVESCTISVEDAQDLNVALYTGVREAGAGGTAGNTNEMDGGVEPGATPGASSGGISADAGMIAAPASRAGATGEDGLAAAAGAAAGTPVEPTGTLGSGQLLPVQFKQADAGDASTPGSVGGVCYDDGVCLVPLDEDEESGWQAGSGDTIELPVAVCRRLEQGRIQGVIISNSCQTKTQATPTCGAWAGEEGTVGDAPSVIGPPVVVDVPPGLVDDFSDGDLIIHSQDGRRGEWVAFSGGDTVAPEVLSDPERGSYLSFSGNSSSEDGEVDPNTLLSVFLNKTASGTYENYDASAYAGVRFFARADRERLPVLLSAPPIELVPESLGGRCTGACAAPIGYQLLLGTDWLSYTVSFEQLFAMGEVYSADEIAGFGFFPLEGGDFTIDIDDLELVDKLDAPMPGAGGANAGGAGPIGEAGGASIGGAAGGSGMDRCDAAKSELIQSLDELRACDPTDETQCGELITVEDIAVHVATPADGQLARGYIVVYEEEVATCNLPGVGNGGEIPDSHCIPTGEITGTCSSFSPYFINPEGPVGPQCGGTSFTPGVDVLIDDFEDADTNVEPGLGDGSWFITDDAGDQVVAPVAGAIGYEGTYGANSNVARDTIGFTFSTACSQDVSTFTGVRFWVQYLGTGEPFLEVNVDTADSAEVTFHPEGRCAVDCPVYQATHYVYPGQFLQVVLPWENFSLVDATEVIGVRFRASDGEPVVIDNVELYNGAATPECPADGVAGMCAANNVCYTDTCYTCGAEFDFCCEGNACGAGMGCYQGLDTPVATDSDPWSSGNYCVACGNPGEPCCEDFYCDSQSTPGLFCNDLTYVCELAQ